MEPRLRTELWVAAYIRRLNVLNIPAYVMRRGDDTSGSVIIKVAWLDGRACIWVPTYDLDGNRIWTSALEASPAEEADADAYITRAGNRDPDIWVVEIENRAGEAHLDGL